MHTKSTSATNPNEPQESVAARPYPQWVIAMIFSSWFGNVLVWPALESTGFDAFWFAVIFGFMFGQAIVLAIFGGLYGVSWTDGFLLGCFVLVVAMYANLLGMRHGLRELWWMPFIAPGLVVAGYVPLMVMRHFYDWRLERPGKSYPKVPVSLSGIFGNVIIVMAAVIALRAPLAFMKSSPDPSAYWMPAAAVGLTLCVFSAITALPIAAFILNCEDNTQRIGRALIVMLVAIFGVGVFLAITAIWSGQPPAGLYRDIIVGAIAVTSVVYLGVLAIRADGYRLRTRADSFRRTASSAAVKGDEASNDLNAQDALFRYQKRIRWQIVGLVLFLIPLNVWLSKVQAKKDTFYAVQRELSAIAIKYEGNVSGQFGAGLYATLKADSNATLDEFTSKVKDCGIDFEHLDLNGAAIDDDCLTDMGGVERINILELSNTLVTGERFAELGNTQINTLRLLGLNLTNADWGSLPNSIVTISVDDSKVSSPTFAAFLLRQNLQAISMRNLTVKDEVWESIKQQRKLTLLNVSGTAATDDQLTPILLVNRGLLSLELADNAITDTTVQSIAEMDSIPGNLNLSNTDVTDEGVSTLAKRYRRGNYGTSLRLSGTKVTGRCFQDWSRLPFSLDLSHSATGNEIQPILERQVGSYLQGLNLSHTRVTDEILPTLVKVNFGVVYIVGTKISANALIKAVGKLPMGTPQVGTWVVGRDQFTKQEMASFGTAGIAIRPEE